MNEYINLVGMTNYLCCTQNMGMIICFQYYRSMNDQQQSFRKKSSIMTLLLAPLKYSDDFYYSGSR